MTEQTADSQTVDPGQHDEVLSRIGHMTRALHESLRGLGLDKLIEKAASDIPDARDRLDYVARLSEQAAKRVLDATDAAGPLQDGIDASAAELGRSWQSLLDSGEGSAEWRQLAEKTVASLAASSVLSMLVTVPGETPSAAASWPVVARGPIWVSSSSGSPMRMRRARSTKASMKRLEILRCTRMREPARHC